MRLRPTSVLASIVALATWSGSSDGWAQDKVPIPSLDAQDGMPATKLDGYLFRPPKTGPVPAVVFLHGCGGLISSVSHRIMSREADWARRLNESGYAVLMVDSFAPRGSSEMCSSSSFKEWIYLRRPADAYGALAWLQQQAFIAKERIAMMGWSNGGGAVLFALGRKYGRPAHFSGPEFRAAVAFYPGSCSEQRMGGDWTPAIPLLVLIGGKDIWTPSAPCKELVDRAVSRGATIDYQLYPGAYHDFDWPNLKRTELPNYTTRAGVVPVVGEDPVARADAIRRVRAFLAGRL
jgi:dienelactone hydrolase